MKQYQSLAAYLEGPPRRTQEELAARLSKIAGFRVPQGTVSKWVRGATMPRPKMAILIKEHLGVAIEGMARVRAGKAA